MTTTTELQEYAGKLFPTSMFQGVFPIDSLPNQEKYKDVLLIVNTDTSNLSGQHWIAIIAIEGVGFVFDPLGYLTPSILSHWMCEHYKLWTCNTRQIQMLITNDCGLFCLHFLYFATTSDLFHDRHFSQIVNQLYPPCMNKFVYRSMLIEFCKHYLFQ